MSIITFKRLLASAVIAGATTFVHAQEKLSVRLDFSPWGIHAAMHLAQEKGWFKQAGLDVARLRGALDQGTFEASVAADKAAAAELQIQGTPAFFINGYRIVGNQPVANFRAAIDRALAERR